MSNQQNILFVIGTRPEAIKLAPLIRKFDEDSIFKVTVCLTAQHRELLDNVIEFFEIEVDHDLDLMTEDQSSLNFISKAVAKLEEVVEEVKPDLLMVQGDTSTVLVGSLVGFYKKISVAHVEAGLRSFNLNAPFPEEMNRLLTSKMSSFHFAPTQAAVRNLKKEGIEQNVYLVGNTVIDSLQYMLQKMERERISFKSDFREIDFSKRIILVSCHRRESFDEPLQQICQAFNDLATLHSDIEVVMLTHPNPKVKETMLKHIAQDKVKLLPPLSYPQLIWLLKASYFIMTDSGGIQEEAPSLSKPVLVLREVTERTEGIEAGSAKLIGVKKEKIVQEASALIQDQQEYNKMAKANNPYGDGESSTRILSILKQNLLT